MTSTRQLKHHARFHAAVLRHFFRSSSPISNTHQEAADLSEEVSFQIESSKRTEHVLVETDTNDKNEEVEAGKALLSRAQRKRLKIKKVKERQSNALHTKRFVGPLLPHLLEKRRLENDGGNQTGALQENDSIEKSSIPPSARDEQVSEDMGKQEVLSSTAREVLAMAKTVEATTRGEVAMGKVEEMTPSLLESGEELAMAKTEEATFSILETRQELAMLKSEETTPLLPETGEELAMLKTEETTTLLPETGEGIIMHDSVELEFLSKAKRRRLAKKKFHDGIRHPISGSSFTAEIRGGDIVIKQII